MHEAHLGVDRQPARVRAPRDAQPRHRDRRGRVHRQRRQRPDALLDRQRVEEQRGVGGVARHRAGHAVRGPGVAGPPAGHPAGARPHADDVAERGGVAEAAAAVGAVRDREHPRGEGGGRASARPSRVAGGVPRVDGRAEDGVERQHALAHLGSVRLADDQRARLAEKRREHAVVRGGSDIGEGRRAVRRREARDVHQVLHRGGQAVQRRQRLARRARLGGPPVGRLGRGERDRVGLLRDDGAEGGVALLDPLEVRAHHLDGRDLAGGDARGERHGAAVGEVLGHQRPPSCPCCCSACSWPACASCCAWS